MRTYESGRMGCAILPASSGNWACRSRETSSMRFTAREFMSELNSCKTKTEPHSQMLSLAVCIHPAPSDAQSAVFRLSIICRACSNLSLGAQPALLKAPSHSKQASPKLLGLKRLSMQAIDIQTAIQTSDDDFCTRSLQASCRKQLAKEMFWCTRSFKATEVSLPIRPESYCHMRPEFTVFEFTVNSEKPNVRKSEPKVRKHA